MEQRTLYEIIGGGVGGLVLIGLTYLTTSAIIKNNYNDRLNKAQVQIANKENDIADLIKKHALLKKDFDNEKKASVSKDKDIAKLEEQVKQGVSLEELRIACIEGDITKDIYKKLKRYTFK